MTFIIEKDTEKGKIQLETIAWMEGQFNKVLANVFVKYRLFRALIIHMIIPDDLDVDNHLKADVKMLQPLTKEEFEKAVEDVKKDMVFKEAPVVGKIVNSKK